jgi:cyclopropane fatty-acyl-phospholipid synthase-like methyltransferase
MRIATRLVVVVMWLAVTGAPIGHAQEPTPSAPTSAHQPGDQTPDHFAHRFDNVEELVKRFDDPSRDEWQMPSRVIDALQLAPGDVVADIGAGTGYFTVRLARSPARPKVYAVDIEPTMIAHLRHRAMLEGLTNVTAVQASADRSNLPEPVDVALVVDTYHHIPNRAAYFTVLKTSMKPGARLAIVDFRKGAPEGPPEEFRFTPQQIREELAGAGFSLEAEHDFLPRQIFLVFTASR